MTTPSFWFVVFWHDLLIFQHEVMSVAHVACQLVLVLRAVLADDTGKNVDAGFVLLNLMMQELLGLVGSVCAMITAVVAADVGWGEIAAAH